jgi:hypothetical protein
VPLTPADGATYRVRQGHPSADVTLSWQPVAGATEYRIELEEYVDIAIPVPSHETGGTTTVGPRGRDVLPGSHGWSGPAGYRWPSGTGPANRPAQQPATGPVLPTHRVGWDPRPPRRTTATTLTLALDHFAEKRIFRWSAVAVDNTEFYLDSPASPWRKFSVASAYDS